MNDRNIRVQSLILEELRTVVAEKFDASKFGYVSINDVELNPKMTYAKVYVYAEKHKNELTKALKADMRKFLPILQSRSDLRYFPRLEFVLDKGSSHADKINQILAKLKRQEEEN